jgi:phosphatidylglycerol---prolipoprotein diacylglyceryl transferase
VTPLIPYIKAPELPLSFLTYIPGVNTLIDPAHPPSIKPFGTLVALGVYIGSVVAMRHARQRGLNEKKMSEFIFWVVGLGFVGGHMLDAIFYHPGRLVRDPWEGFKYFFALWDGLSSYGGFIGAVIGALAWRLYRKEPILGFCEVINSAFPLAWVFGRAGCASVHDHPGMPSDAWFAVQPSLLNNWPVGRLDLGLIEMVLTIPLAVAFLILWHRKPERPLGFYTGFMCVAYAPVRFFLDFLREDERDALLSGGDPRYGGLTPAQWACFGLLAMGIYFLRIWYKGQRAEVEEQQIDAPVDEADVVTLDEAALLAEGALVTERTGTPVSGGSKKKRRKKASDRSTALERKPPPSSDRGES